MARLFEHQAYNERSLKKQDKKTVFDKSMDISIRNSNSNRTN
jgi:hypothetical protein